MSHDPLFRSGPAAGTDTRPVMSEHRVAADTLACVTEPLLRRLADYWLSRRAGRVMPARADIDPLDIPWALPHLYLVDCVSDAGPGADGGRWRYRYRVAGDEVEAVFRSHMGRSSARNTWLDDMLAPDTLKVVMDRWRPLPESGRIVHMQGMIYKTIDRYARGGRLLLPLADAAGGPVTGFVGATTCGWVAEVPTRAAADITITYIPAAALA